MIRINLLPVRAVKKQELGKKQLVLFALVLVGTAIGNYYWFSDRADANDRLRAQIANVERELAQLDEKIGRVKDISNQRDKIKSKLKVLDQLKAGRTGPVKMLDALATAIPKNVWVHSMTETAGAMKLDATAISNDDVAAFMKSLATIVWTPDGMARMQTGGVAAPAAGAAPSLTTVKLLPSEAEKSFAPDKVSVFFKDITLGRATLKGSGSDKTVDFSLTLKANLAI